MHTPQTSIPRLLRRAAVENVTGTGRSQIYRLMERGLFPRPVDIGPQAVAWLETEIRAIVNAWIRGATEDAVRNLVAKLHAERGYDDTQGAARRRERLVAKRRAA